MPPPRPFLFDFGSRGFICKSCLSASRRPSPAATIWPVRQSSRVAAAMNTSRTIRKLTPPKDADRRKALETLGLLEKDDKQLHVNYYEQQNDGSMRRLQNDQEFSESLSAPDAETEAEIEALEKRSQGLERLVKTVDSFLGKFSQWTKDADDPGNGQDTDAEQSISQLAIPINGLNGNRQDRIHKVNNWIRRCNKAVANNELLPKDIQGLWKAYTAIRTTMSGRWNTVPLPTWEVLWKTLSANFDFNTNRMSHIYALAKDMQQAGVALRPDQQLLALEAMFIDGWKNEAIENHRRHVSTLGANPETFLPFWELGLLMYCRIGDLQRAERVIMTITESPYEPDPKFIQPFIKLCAENPATVDRAFALYRELRATLGESMTLDDYDSLISYFLTSNSTEYALFIFVDMMKSGSIDLVGARQYPPSVANPFFFGKWTKRLIGAGDLEGALNVFRFQRSQGITPRAMQVNVLIGEWLRSGAAEDAQKAEDVAWAMINARIQFVELRRRKAIVPEVRLYPSGDAWPRANLETFSILAENYRERSLASKMAPLWHAFREAEIAPNSFMLNQLLMSHVQEGRAELVPSIYQNMVEQYNLKADPHTFMVLWKTLPVNRLARLPPKDTLVESARTRALFKQMMQSISVFREDDDLKIDKFLARNVLHSFRKLGDQTGLLIVYRALRRKFHYTPPDMVVFEMLIGSQDLEGLTKRRDNVAKRRDAAKVIQLRASLDHFLAHRSQELKKSGEIKTGEDMPQHIKNEETADFLELHLQQSLYKLEEGEAQRLAMEAAQDLGLVGEIANAEAQSRNGDM
ncbi:hypothetical protein F5Y16DRAFT_387173 [Xylariaceae sp. FL0255]|nr:hypothetical protein F5Y16DRAFT_387173 [Xylariaceae sp. FL0255]